MIIHKKTDQDLLDMGHYRLKTSLETGKPLAQETVRGSQTETVETKVWGGNDGKAGVSVGHTVVSDSLSREEMAAISRRFVVEHYRLTYTLFLEGDK